MAHFEATPRYEYEELKKIKGQHVKTLNEQRRQTIQVGNSAKQRLKERIQQRIKTEERRRSSVMLNLGHSGSVSQVVFVECLFLSPAIVTPFLRCLCAYVSRFCGSCSCSAC